ncbi:MAG: hypothetical protein K0S95_3215, partial [Pantoea eucrina]|nr:hypothetical protein [Pantoea eucrina]
MDTRIDGYPLTGLPKTTVSNIIHAPYRNDAAAT